jgi:hypothetical protein
MCLGGRKRQMEEELVKKAKDPEVEAEQESQEFQANKETKQLKKQAVEQVIKKRRGGTGRRSLITGTGGGIGYYNKYFGGIE